MDYTAYNKPGQPYRYYYRPGGKAITDDPTFKATGMNFDAAALYYTASWSNMTGSQHLDLTGSNIGVTYPDSTFAIRSIIDK